MPTLDWQLLTHHLDRARRVALAVHEKPDGDALGSMLALAEHLEERGHAVVRFSVDPVPRHFQFLPQSERVTNDLAVPAAADAVVLLDIGDVARAGLPLSAKGEVPAVLVIDHHPTRLRLAGSEVVDAAVIHPPASSTCELVYQFIRARQGTITKSMATSLLTGLLTDTGAFQNAATTDAAFALAADLLLQGARWRAVQAATVRNKSVAALRLWGRVLERLKEDPATGLVSTAIFQSDLSAGGVGEEASDGVANFLNGLGHARLTLVLKEEPDGRVRGSYRTTRDDVDVAALAARLGGGGHRQAAGFAVRGHIQERPTAWQVIRAPD